MTEENNYVKLATINVNEKTEKKGNLTYLSWAWAVDQLLRIDPEANWEYKDPVYFGGTLMVFCTVHALGKSMTAQLPVMNHKNQAIENPDAFQVNTAMQRCLAKAIALHGLGLYIYAGEDLPEPPMVATHRRKIIADAAKAAITKFAANDEVGAYEEVSGITDSEEKLELWSLLHDHSKLRSSLKRQALAEREASQKATV